MTVDYLGERLHRTLKYPLSSNVIAHVGASTLRLAAMMLGLGHLAVVDDLLRHPQDNPSIGLILCKEKKALTVEYALRNTGAAIGVSEYLITEALPDELRTSLPTVEQLEAELINGEEDEANDTAED